MKEVSISESILFRFSIITFIILSFTGCSTYSGLSKPVQSAYKRGDYAGAVAALDKTQVKKRDKLLYFLDKGALLHYAEKYEESNKAFAEAEDLADLLETKSATKEVGATVTNETLLNYAGEKYERLLINVFKMLNYAALEKWQGALVEVRRLNTMKEKLFQKEMKNVYKNPFSLFISAVLWSIRHHHNDAYIDYKKGFDLISHKEIFGPELLYLSKRLGGLHQDRWKEEFEGMEPKDPRGKKALIVFVIEGGLAPVLGSEETSFLDQKISLPVLQERSSRVASAKIFIDEEKKPILETKVLAQVSDMVSENLPHKRKVAGTRKVVKGVVKAGAQVATYEAIAKSGGKKSSKESADRKLAGFAAALLVGALFNATERADIRIWSTLPETWGAGKLELEPGEHQIRVRFYNEHDSPMGQEVTRTVDLKKRQNVFMIFRRL